MYNDLSAYIIWKFLNKLKQNVSIADVVYSNRQSALCFFSEVVSHKNNIFNGDIYRELWHSCACCALVEVRGRQCDVISSICVVVQPSSVPVDIWVFTRATLC